MGCDYDWKGAVPNPADQERIVRLVLDVFGPFEHTLIHPHPEIGVATSIQRDWDLVVVPDYPFNFFGIIPHEDLHGQFVFDRSNGGRLVSIYSAADTWPDGSKAYRDPEASNWHLPELEANPDVVIAVEDGGNDRDTWGKSTAYTTLLFLLQRRYGPWLNCGSDAHETRRWAEFVADRPEWKSRISKEDPTKELFEAFLADLRAAKATQRSHGAAASAHLKAYRSSNSRPDLDESIRQIRAANAASPSAEYDGAWLADRLEERAEPSDLDEALSIRRHLLLDRLIAERGEVQNDFLTSMMGEARAEAFTALAKSYYRRAQKQDRLADLDEALRQIYFALDEPTTKWDASAKRADMLYDLGSILEARFYLRLELSDYKRAIEAKKEALRLTPEESAWHAHRKEFLARNLELHEAFADDRLLRELRTLNANHPDDADVRRRLAKGLFHTLRDAKEANDLPRRDELLQELRTLNANHPDDAANRGQLAEGLFRTLLDAKEENNLPRRDEHLQELRTLNANHPDDADVRGHLALGLANTLRHAKEENDLRRMDELLQELRTLNATYPDDTFVGRHLARALPDAS